MAIPASGMFYIPRSEHIDFSEYWDSLDLVMEEEIGQDHNTQDINIDGADQITPQVQMYLNNYQVAMMEPMEMVNDTVFVPNEPKE